MRKSHQCRSNKFQKLTVVCTYLFQEKVKVDSVIKLDYNLKIVWTGQRREIKMDLFMLVH